MGYNLYAYCNNNPIMYGDETGYAAEYRVSAQCDPEILRLIKKANLDAPLDMYLYCKRVSNYMVYYFQGEPTIINNKFLWWKWTVVTYTKAAYYFKIIDKIDYQKKLKNSQKQLNIVKRMNTYISDFTTFAQVDDLGLAIVMLCTGTVSGVFFDNWESNLESDIERYSTTEEYELHHVLLLECSTTNSKEEITRSSILYP